MNRPDIKTAVPQRRYKIGEFTLVVLGDIESADANQYRYVMGVVREGEGEPGMYLTCETGPVAEGEGSAMRIILPDGAKVLGTDPAWEDIDAFCRDALKVVVKLLDLQDEEPFRLT